MRDPKSCAATRLTSLYEAHSADVFRYALHITGRREDAEDVVQHVFLGTYSVLETGRELVNPRAWLIKAAKHRSLNLLRDRRDTPIADVERRVPFAPGEGEAEALAEVRAALWSLPESQHHAFVLRHWSGLSQDEIADVLATTPAAVESLLVRARATLVAEREEGDPECTGVRRRLARMLAPTPEQRAHLADCRRCRTAQTRLLRASEFATAFALVPSPHVLHALATAIPGFGASGAVAGASATGAAAGAGSGGAAASAVSAATKVGILAKVAVAATTAAVAVTAVHPIRTAVTHAIFHQTPAVPASATPKHGAAPTTSVPNGAAARADAGAPVIARPAPPATDGGGNPTATGAGGTPAKPGKDGAGKDGAGKGQSGSAGSNGDGNGNGKGTGQGGGGASGGATHGRSATAPGRSKTSGSTGAAGRGGAKGKSATNGHAGGASGAKPSGGAGSGAGAGGAKSNPPGAGSGAAKSPGAGAGSGKAGGKPDGKGTGKP